jgi:hydroxymethylpyrimidine/phosphomethylpyrimidine kinase
MFTKATPLIHESVFIRVYPWLNRSVRRPKELGVALTIAGSDSGGGAGIQADLKTFAALKVHGTSAITCITAQNPKRISVIEPCSPRIVRAQIEAVFEALPPQAAKTGMLFSAEIVREVGRCFSARPCPLVIDPVLIATSGARLLKVDAMKVLMEKVFPLAALITPNAPEAEALLQMKIREPEDLRIAARRLHERFGCSVLAKGGHLPGTDEAIDLLFDGKSELLLSSPRIRGKKTHGTGCIYSAAIVAYLAKGKPLTQAVRLAKEFTWRAIALAP